MAVVLKNCGCKGIVLEAIPFIFEELYTFPYALCLTNCYFNGLMF